jgi:L-threonylcarbamoyladenylate synthase
VYGLGADAENTDAVRRVFEVKGRPPGHPLIVHLGHPSSLDEEWSRHVSDEARALAAAFWPGPLTLLVLRGARVSDVVTGGSDRVGLRVPAHPVARELLTRFGGGVAAPSANRFGAVSPTTAAHVRADLGDDVDCVLDGGASEVGIESTIVDCSVAWPEILRPGAVTSDAIAHVIGHEPARWSGERAVAAPGTLEAHYSPRAEVRLVDDHAEVVEAVRAAAAHASPVGVLASQAIPDLPEGTVELTPAGDDAAFAHVLYERLRDADRRGLSVLIVVPPADRGIGGAVRDRLRRAATRS